MMLKYADAHQGTFPTGASSTEIFQKLVDDEHMIPSSHTYEEIVLGLIDRQEANDTGIFYVKLPGKTMATSSILRPENVCFDATASLDKGSPGELPVVFVTGYRISYVSGGTATPLSEASPHWTAVCYMDDSGRSLFGDIQWPNQPNFQQNGSITNFIPATFNPAGKKYQQLTPNGPLSP